MTLAVRTQALLDLVEQERERQCSALVADALAQAAALRSASRAQARQRLHEAFAEERARTQARRAAAAAELQTRRRVHAQRHLAERLALAWQRLPQALAERWRDADARAVWVAATLDSARTALAPGAWRVIHAPGWDGEGTGPLRCEVDERIAAGLRIVAGGNVVDATLQGLLADRQEIGGRLVGLLQAPEEPADPQCAPPAPGSDPAGGQT